MALTQVDQGLLGQYAQYTGFKNRIINGAMVIDQRNAGAEINPAVDGTFYLDRYIYGGTQASKFKIGQNAGNVTPPVGFKYYSGLTSLSAYSVTSTDYFIYGTRIEGYNMADLAWGTANAQTVTLSFWVYSSLTGTFGASIVNQSGDRSYPFSYTISAANTWEQKTVTIPGPTAAGTWNTTNNRFLSLYFGLGAGSTYTGPAGAWANAYYVSANGCVSVAGTSGATFYITGVQLEKGSTATSFDYRPYGTELQLCQRYYYRLKAATSYTNAGSGRAYSITNGQAFVAMPVSMRAAPVSTGYSALTDWNAAQASGNITAMSPAAQYSADFRQMTIDVTATFTSGSTVALNANNTTNAWIEWSAEL